MTLVKYTPRRGLWKPSVNRFNDIDGWFTNIFSDISNEYKNHNLNPRYDINSYDDRYEILVEVPGVIKKDVNVQVSDGVLTIDGERKDSSQEKMHSTLEYGKFSRSFYIPDDAVDSKLSASMENGILTITIPRIEPKRPKVKQIKIG